MPNVHALIIAVDGCLHPSWGSVPYAAQTAEKMLRTLQQAGVKASDIQSLVGPYATLAGMESGVRRFRTRLRRGDTAIVYIVCRMLNRDGVNSLIAWDTVPDDSEKTSLPFPILMKELLASRAGTIAVFLDTPAGVNPLPSSEDSSDRLLLMGSCQAEESSSWLPGAESSAWSAILRETIDTHDGPAITGEVLHTAIQAALATRLRKHGESHIPRPWCRGASRRVILEPPPRSVEAVLSPGHWQRLSLRGETRTRVKDLPGFRKSFRVPTSAGPASQAFVARCAFPRIRLEIDELAERIRAEFHYQRRDVHVAVVKGKNPASIRTPDFEFSLSVLPARDEPSEAVWRREVGQLSERQVVESAEFRSVFGPHVAEIALEYERPIDLEQSTSDLESRLPRGSSIRWQSERCELNLPGLSGTVVLGRKEVLIRGKLGNPASLLEQFLAFLQKYASAENLHKAIGL